METSDEKRTPIRLAAENELVDYDEIVEILGKAIGEIPDDVKLLQMSKATIPNRYNMRGNRVEYDLEKAKNKFSELLSSLSPELVRSRITYLFVHDGQILGEPHRNQCLGQSTKSYRSLGQSSSRGCQ